MGLEQIVLHWDLFKPDAPRPVAEKVMARLLTIQTALNVEFLRRNPDAPSILDSGLRYAAEGPYNEVWQTLPIMLAGDVADCEDLACAWAAECIVREGDRDARAVFYGREIAPGKRLYHVVVRRGNGDIEDPSRWLGMGERPGKRRPLR